MDGLTDSQTRAWELLHGENSVFLTGEAGSGKSFLIKRLTELQDPKAFPVLASTGAAAVLIGGRTLHSFLGLGILEGGVDRAVAKALSDKRVVRRVKRAKGLIIDEISMISGQTLAAAERVCRLAKEEEIPWGGLKIVVVGDFAQLPPVERARQGVPDWAFKSHTWLESEFRPALLEQNLRTGNSEFLQVLHSVRKGEVNPLVRDFARDRMREMPQDFAGTVLFPRRQQADQHNDRKLDGLKGQVRQFASIYGGESRYIEALKRYSPLPEELKVKEGALVMLRQNDPRGRWVNGSTGVLENFGADFLGIQLLSGRRVEIEMTTFSMLDAEGKVRASVTNYPVILAWAATIHKSQGMTLDRLAVDLGQLWEPGQAYVALSRITTPENLWLTRWQETSVKADPLVTRFYQEMGAK
ncbi:MAG: AAA family ATPase [Bdellovibrionales bacterium]|nr:AAA family ATPase [Bdellovibrionales bacterium]